MRTRALGFTSSNDTRAAQVVLEPFPTSGTNLASSKSSPASFAIHVSHWDRVTVSRPSGAPVGAAWGLTTGRDLRNVRRCLAYSSSGPPLLISFSKALFPGRDGLWNGTASTCSTPSRFVHEEDRKSTRLNSSHRCMSYAVFCL